MNISKKTLGICMIILGVSVGVGLSCVMNEKNKDDHVKYIDIQLENKVYKFILEGYQLYIEPDNTSKKKMLLDEPLVDAVAYDMNQDGKEELLVLTLNQEGLDKDGRRFGKELRFYKLEQEEESVEPTLIYRNNISSVKPFMIEAGSLERGEVNIFLGVYKDTKYYKEIINRPFFFSWNGKFIERKWTGSYLSHNELMDLVFVDLTGDGSEEIAVLEEVRQDVYQVALYKWLNFGFDYLATSKSTYNKQGVLKVGSEAGKCKIKIEYIDGTEEDVAF